MSLYGIRDVVEDTNMILIAIPRSLLSARNCKNRRKSLRDTTFVAFKYGKLSRGISTSKHSVLKISWECSVCGVHLLKTFWCFPFMTETKPLWLILWIGQYVILRGNQIVTPFFLYKLRALYRKGIKYFDLC